MEIVETIRENNHVSSVVSERDLFFRLFYWPRSGFDASNIINVKLHISLFVWLFGYTFVNIKTKEKILVFRAQIHADKVTG